MINFCNTLLSNDKVHATPVDIGKKNQTNSSNR